MRLEDNQDLRPLFSCKFFSLKIMLSLVWLILFSYSTLVATQNVPYNNNNNNNPFQAKSIFILAGQSNMSGRGGVTNTTWDHITPPESQPTPLILRLNAERNWEEAHEPLHIDIDVNKTCGVGPGMSFAHSVLERDVGIKEIGLVPCAIGGTNISEWRRGGGLYNELVVRAKAALGDGGMVRAILWYQGESDTEMYRDAKLYKRRLVRFFSDLRFDLGLPMLPIIQVALASGQGPYIEIVRKAQMEIDLPNVRFVDAKGLPLQLDGLHLTTASQVRLGKMLADAFLRIMAPLPVQSNAPKRFNVFFLNFFLRWFR